MSIKEDNGSHTDSDESLIKLKARAYDLLVHRETFNRQIGEELDQIQAQIANILDAKMSADK